MLDILNGDSMRNQRQSLTSTGPTTLWKFMEMVDIHMSDPQPQRTPDGGNCSRLKENTSEPSKKVRTSTSMFKVPLILKEDTSNVTKPRTVRFINNGMLSTLMNIQMNQPRVNSTKTSVSMLKDHSTLSLPSHHTDTLI